MKRIGHLAVWAATAIGLVKGTAHAIGTRGRDSAAPASHAPQEAGTRATSTDAVKVPGWRQFYQFMKEATPG
jgi:hypothetical protein